MKNPNAVLVSGAAALLLANVLNMLLRWAHGTTEMVMSGAMGVLYGMSFALMLWSIRLRKRQGLDPLRTGPRRCCQSGKPSL